MPFFIQRVQDAGVFLIGERIFQRGQRGEDHAAIGGAIRENSGLKLRIEELEAENEELQKEIDKLQAEVEKQKNKADDAGNEADAEADESEDGSDEGTDEEVRAGY